MAGSELDVKPRQRESGAGMDLFGEWVAPILAFVIVVGLFLALIGAMLAPAE